MMRRRAAARRSGLAVLGQGAVAAGLGDSGQRVVAAVLGAGDQEAAAACHRGKWLVMFESNETHDLYERVDRGWRTSRQPKLQKKSAAVSNVKTSKFKKIKNEDLVDDTKKTKKGAATKDNEKVKKEKKVYELPGQKHDPPQERDPLKIFYESLYEQVPTSEMAATWLMEWGLLPFDVARKVFEKKQGQKLKSPVKTTSAKRAKHPNQENTVAICYEN
ncbi:hypothetical protein ABZP36_023285 [Zizania latifolia]